MKFEATSPDKSFIYNFFRTPWKTAVTSTVISLIITIIVVQYFNGWIPFYVPFIVIASAFPVAYGASTAILRYQQIIDQQNESLVALTTELMETNGELQDHNQKLNDLTQMLEASNAELNAYTGTVAHDLKNPLSTIINYLELSEYYLANNDSKQVAQKIEQAKQGALQSVQIVDSLLLLANIRQEDRIQTETIEMDQVIAQVQERLDLMIAEYNAQLQLPAKWPSVRGYAPWIAEVWINYVTNALKYGGHPPTVTLGSDQNDQGVVRFWVRDNGSGISANQQGLLFREFSRLCNSAEGHGLGLSIVKRIVEKLGGQVGVESQKGQGSLFYFTLPEA